MQFASKTPRLYGITESNSNRTGSNLWGKNQFNSTFPLSLCLYMRDKNIDPVSVTLESGELSTNDNNWDMNQLVGNRTENPKFLFESKFEPYDELVKNMSKNKIDLIVKLDGGVEYPYEIKLTVVPDSSTGDLEEIDWGPEIVIRPVSSAYAMMGVARSIKSNILLQKEVINSMKPTFELVNDWNEMEEILDHADDLKNSFDNTMKLVERVQSPFLIQAIWKTNSQSHELSLENCFDVFVWSDVALLKPLSLLANPTHKQISRPLRELIKNFRALYQILAQGWYDYEEVFINTAFGKQTDKAYRLNGKQFNEYFSQNRLHKPVLPANIIKKIILNGGEKELKPERRLDMAVLLYTQNE